MTGAIVARLLAADPALASHVQVATAGYRRALTAVGQQVPTAVDDFLIALSDCGHLARIAAVRADDGDATGTPGVTVSEAAEVARVSTRTLCRWLADGRLPYQGRGRVRLIPAPALVQFLEQRRSA